MQLVSTFMSRTIVWDAVCVDDECLVIITCTPWMLNNVMQSSGNGEVGAHFTDPCRTC